MAKRTGALKNKAYKPNSSLKRLAEIRDFSGGINLTSGSNSKYNNQVDTLVNFEITSGGEISKRPGSEIIHNIENFDYDNKGQLYGFVSCIIESDKNIQNKNNIFFLKGGDIYNGNGDRQNYYSYKELFSDDSNFNKTGEYIEEDPSDEFKYKTLAPLTSDDPNICGNQQLDNGIMYWKAGNKILMYPVVGSWVVSDNKIKINHLTGSPVYNAENPIGLKAWIELPKYVISAKDLDIYGVNTFSNTPNKRIKKFINPSEAFLDSFNFNISGDGLFDVYNTSTATTCSKIFMETKSYDTWSWEDMVKKNSKTYGILTKFLTVFDPYATGIKFYKGWNKYIEDPDAEDLGATYWKDKFKPYHNTNWDLLHKYDYLSFNKSSNNTAIKTWRPKNKNTVIKGNIKAKLLHSLVDVSFIDIINDDELKKLTLSRTEFNNWTGWKQGIDVEDINCKLTGSYGEGYSIYLSKDKSNKLNLGETQASNKYGNPIEAYTVPFVKLLKKTINNNQTFFNYYKYGDLSDWTFTLHPSNLGAWNRSVYNFLSTTDVEIAPFILDGASSRGMSSDKDIKPSYFESKITNVRFPVLSFENKTTNWIYKYTGSIKKTALLTFNNLNAFKTFIGSDWDLVVDTDPTYFPSIKIKGWKQSDDFIEWASAQKKLQSLIWKIKENEVKNAKIKGFNVEFKISINNKDEVLEEFKNTSCPTKSSPLQENIKPEILLNLNSSIYWEVENTKIKAKDLRPKLLDIFINKDTPLLGDILTATATVSGVDYRKVFNPNIYYSWNILTVNEIGNNLYKDFNYSLDISDWNAGTGSSSDKDILQKEFVMVDSVPHTIFAFKALIPPPTGDTGKDDMDWVASGWPELEEEVKAFYGKTGSSEKISKQEFFDWSLEEQSLDIVPQFKSDLFDYQGHIINQDLTDFDFMIFNGLMLLYSGDKIWVSTPYNYSYFPKSYIKPLASEGGQEGRKIQKIKYFQNSLIVFTNQDIHRLSGTNPNSTGTNPIKITKINNNYGAIIKNAIVNMNNKVVFISDQGIFGLYSVAASIDDAWNIKRLDEDIYGLIDYSKFPDTKAILYKDSIIFNFNGEKESKWLIYKEGEKNNNWCVWESSYFDLINFFNSNGEIYWVRKKETQILKLGYKRKALISYHYEDKEQRPPQYDKGELIPGYTDGYNKSTGDIGEFIESTLITKKYDLDFPLHYKKLKKVQIISENLKEPTTYNIDVNMDGESIIETEIYELIPDGKALRWSIKDSKKSIGKIYGSTNINSSFYYNGSIYKDAPYTYKNVFKTSGKGLTVQVKLKHNKDTDFQVSNLGFLYKLKKAK